MERRRYWDRNGSVMMSGRMAAKGGGRAVASGVWFWKSWGFCAGRGRLREELGKPPEPGL